MGGHLHSRPSSPSLSSSVTTTRLPRPRLLLLLHFLLRVLSRVYSHHDLVILVLSASHTASLPPHQCYMSTLNMRAHHVICMHNMHVSFVRGGFGSSSSSDATHFHISTVTKKMSKWWAFPLEILGIPSCFFGRKSV